MHYVLVIVSVFLMCLSPLKAKADTVTYIVKTQKEREDTRFTLTEWLRIKERMKMMDVWLAMFSEPSKSTFRPELNLSYGQTVGLLGSKITPFTPPVAEAQTALATGFSASESKGRLLKGQMWLTNLISGTFGVRTLNVDLGLDSMLHKSEETWLLGNVGQKHIKDIRGNHIAFRVFGKNVQDSSFVLKAGEYQGHRSMPLDEATVASLTIAGQSRGGSLHLYISSWLGLFGDYQEFQKDTEKGYSVSGLWQLGGLYLEISIFRVVAGLFHEEFTWENEQHRIDEKNVGKYTGLEINF